MIKKILVVDDHNSIRLGLSKALHKYCDFQGEVSVAENGKTALEEIGSSFYDICFLDMNLPDISGLDVMDKIRAISPATKIVIMTAGYLDDDIKKKIEDGAFMFVAKPIELDIIKNFINNESAADEDSRNGGSNNPEYCLKERGVDHTAADYVDVRVTEKRRLERRPDTRTVNYSMSVFYNWELKSSLEGAMIDLHMEGAGLITYYPLHPGNVLRFDSSLENKSGIVKWSVKKENKYRAGIKFI